MGGCWRLLLGFSRLGEGGFVSFYFWCGLVWFGGWWIGAPYAGLSAETGGGCFSIWRVFLLPFLVRFAVHVLIRIPLVEWALGPPRCLFCCRV